MARPRKSKNEFASLLTDLSATLGKLSKLADVLKDPHVAFAISNASKRVGGMSANNAAKSEKLDTPKGPKGPVIKLAKSERDYLVTQVKNKAEELKIENKTQLRAKTENISDTLAENIMKGKHTKDILGKTVLKLVKFLGSESVEKWRDDLPAKVKGAASA